MSKKKNIFQIRKIRSRKKSLGSGKFADLKRFLHRYDTTLRHASLVILTLLGTWLVHDYQQGGLSYMFKASVLEAPQPFTGTVFPIDKVPNWTHWGGDNKITLYTAVDSSKLINLPNYDLKKMQFPNESLIWGNTEHDVIRNTKITYPVVYLGNYKLDHVEGSGSHLAVDIKMPVGTPIKSIANGVVVKVSMTSTGFGHHVVIMHRNVPDPDNPNLTTTLYSGFNHMDKITVSEGQKVTKGQLIGTSGNTGTSTTPHLHFQIDRDSAPWHPYWPFSWSESQEAGLSFFEAVNAGLGLTNAKAHTINPMNYVTEHLNYSGSTVSSGSDTHSDTGTSVSGTDSNEVSQEDPVEVAPDPEPEEEVVTVETIPEEELEVPTTTEVSTNVDTSLFEFQLVAEKVSFINNGVTVSVTDKKGQIAKMNDTDELRVSLTGVGRLSKKVFRKADFKNDSIKLVVNSSEAGKARVEIGKSIAEIEFIEEIMPIASLRVEHDERFQLGVAETITFTALDDNGNPTPATNFAGVINVTVKEGDATVAPATLSSSDFRNGVATIKLTSTTDKRVIIRAQNGAIIGEADPIYVESSQVFSDVNRNHPNYEAIKYLEEYRIINGYPDGTYKPGSTVNRVEALKMLMLAFDVEAGPAGKLPFSDTADNEWYANTLATAVERAIVRGYEDGTFKPGQTVNKAEYLKMLFLTNGIEPSSNLSANPYNDVPKDAWYAPYAYLTNKRNLLDVPTGELKPGTGMTRGDVAETIYRLIYLLENDMVTYNR
ncbi:MAG: S-layer homology domain-containing protein [Candidatus Peregrinibacteria bacterium]|nr:S-layer homology domain-containing protein [Candidatus Peregrinibacteria bacterium]